MREAEIYATFPLTKMRYCGIMLNSARSDQGERPRAANFSKK
jgi:hypothetical protein